MPLSRLEQLFEDGLTALRKQRYNRAHDCFFEAMEMEPEMPQIHYNMGLVLGHLHRWEDAIESFELAAKLDPHPDTYVHLGLANLRLRNWERALGHLDAALSLEPSSEVARVHRDDLASFLAHESRSPEACPLLCADWFDTRLRDFIGVDPEIIPKDRRGEIREYIAQQFEESGEGCDDTLALAEEWALMNGLDARGVCRFLYDRGLRCDCEVLAEGEGTGGAFNC